MVKIRLAQFGRKNRLSYRIVVIDSNAKRDGKYIEKIGHYNPYENAEKPVFDKERYDYWLSVGAQPTRSVFKLALGTYVYKFKEVKSEVESTAKEEPSTE